MHGKTENGWGDRQPRPYTLRKSGNCTARASANPTDRSPDPDAVWSLFDDPGYELQIEDVARCCRARLALDAASRKLAA